MWTTLRKSVALLTALAMLGSSLATTAPRPAEAQTSDAAMARCNVADEESFRAEVDKLTLAALAHGLENVDYKGLVGEGWRKVNAGPTLDARVDKSIEEIQQETSWTTLLQSLASQESAQKLATAVAERTYRSEEMKKAVEDVAVEVSKLLASRIELATLDAAVPAVGCVKAFLGPRYGSTISLVVAGDTGKAFETAANAGSADITTGDLALEAKGLIAGAVILIVRRSLANMAKRIGQRVVGAVLGRIISVVAGGIGLVLIAKDVWDLRNGVLPIIAEEMKADETKEKVQAEIAASIAEQLGTHLKEMSAATADRILEVWRQFKQAHAKVVELSGRLPAFKTLVDSIEAAQIPRLDRVVALVLDQEGEGGLTRRLENGTLVEAVQRSPDAVLDIAHDTRSLDEAFAWQHLAGDGLDKVLKLEIYRLAKPEAFTEASLAKLVALDDAFAIGRIAALPRAGREAVMQLAAGRTVALARALTPDELASFAGYIQSLRPNAALRLMTAVADDPQRMKLFASPSVQAAVLGSRDQDAAVGIMLRNGTLIDTISIQKDVELVTSGEVSPLILWHKHTLAAWIVLGFGGLILLMLLRIMLAPRRRPARRGA